MSWPAIFSHRNFVVSRKIKCSEVWEAQHNISVYKCLGLLIQNTQYHMLVSVLDQVPFQVTTRDKLYFSICTFKTCGSAPKLILATELERRRISCSLTSPSDTSARPVKMSVEGHSNYHQHDFTKSRLKRYIFIDGNLQN